MTNLERRKIRTVTREKTDGSQRQKWRNCSLPRYSEFKVARVKLSFRKSIFIAVSLLLVFDFSSLGCEDVHAICDVKSNLLLEILL